MDYVFSEDLGRVGDYHGRILTRTRMQVRSRTEATREWGESPDTDVMYPAITVTWIDRNQMSYDKLVDDTHTRLNDHRIAGNSFHLVDATGVGIPTIDFMRRKGLTPIGIWLTSGQAAHEQTYGYTVPKVEVINALQIALSSGMLIFAKGLNEAHVSQLLHEFKTFKEKISRAGHTTWEAWREKDHDDLVLALAINVWWILKIHGVNLVRKRKVSTQEDYNPLKDGL